MRFEEQGLCNLSTKKHLNTHLHFKQQHEIYISIPAEHLLMFPVPFLCPPAAFVL